MRSNQKDGKGVGILPSTEALDNIALDPAFTPCFLIDNLLFSVKDALEYLKLSFITLLARYKHLGFHTRELGYW